MTSDPTDGVSLSYDQENRITGASGYSYTYDADGNRVKKTNGSTGTLYWYMSPGIVAESDLLGVLKSEYVFFDGERVARRDNPTGASPSVAYYFSDHLKTASVITDSVGNITSESDYYPWGGEIQFVANDSNHYKFTGKERDETGLDYFGARHYSNGMGRFITPDWAAKPTQVPYAELGDPQSLNLYSYVRNIPTTRFDADGHTIVLSGDDKDKADEQKRILANASKKGEAALFKTQTGKDGKTKLVLDKKAAAHFKGQHSKGFNMIVQTIDAKPTLTVQMTNTDSQVLSSNPKTRDITIGLDRNVSGMDRVNPMRDSKGNVIPNPFNIIAGHEILGHGRLEMLGDHGWYREGSGSKTFQIENQLRKEQGILLRPEGEP
jgi:RHS repeat-associated protein